MEPQRNNDLLLTYEKQLNQNGLLMNTIDAESSLLSFDEFYMSNVVVVLCEQGSATFYYDFTPVEFRVGDMILVMPGHIISWCSVSPDYKVRTIGISDEFCNRIRHLNHSLYTEINRNNADNAVVHLTGKQYAQMCEAYDMMQMVSQVGKKWKENMMLYTFLTIIMLHYELCPDNNKEKKQVSSLSMRFQEAVVKHYRESSDVDFYARMFGLSPKYFSYLIKSEIGIAPKRWINNYIAMQAKTMLIKRSDLNIQQVAYLLGFKEQTSFTRFFKSYVGVSPREYRDNPGALK